MPSHTFTGQRRKGTLWTCANIPSRRQKPRLIQSQRRNSPFIKGVLVAEDHKRALFSVQMFAGIDCSLAAELANVHAGRPRVQCTQMQACTHTSTRTQAERKFWKLLRQGALEVRVFIFNQREAILQGCLADSENPEKTDVIRLPKKPRP